MIRDTSLVCSARTALAIARYVLPVPAGPMPNTMVCASIASTYRFWFSVFGRIVLPRRDRMSRVSTSAGDSPSLPVSIATLCRTTSGVSGWLLAAIAISSEMTRSAHATSPGSPVRVSALPRAWMSAARMLSNARRFSSAEPRRPTMRSGGTLMLLRTGVSASALVSLGVTWGFLPASWVLDCFLLAEYPVYRRKPTRRKCLTCDDVRWGRHRWAYRGQFHLGV